MSAQQKTFSQTMLEAGAADHSYCQNIINRQRDEIYQLAKDRDILRNLLDLSERKAKQYEEEIEELHHLERLLNERVPDAWNERKDTSTANKTSAR